jgi:hypothetical protein
MYQNIQNMHESPEQSQSVGLWNNRLDIGSAQLSNDVHSACSAWWPTSLNIINFSRAPNVLNFGRET